MKWGQQHPDEWINAVLNGRLYDLQARIARAVFRYKRVAVKSCSGSGKSYDAARIALAFLENYFPSTVITTAPTYRQVESILWREIAAAYVGARYPLAGELTAVGLNIREDWFAIGLSTDQPERFQGLHNENVLVIGDEASGLTEAVFSAIENPMATGNAHLLYIGNPTNPSGGFYDCFNSPLYTKFHISAFDTPNFTAFGITLDDIRQDIWVDKILGRRIKYAERDDKLDAEITAKLPMPSLITPQWVAERHVEWGEGSFLWQVYVMGEFPEAGVNNLFRLTDIEAAIERKVEGVGDMRAALDIARYGDDESVLGYRQGNHVYPMDSWAKSDTRNTTGIVVRKLRIRPPLSTMVDSVGLGAGVFDNLEAEVKEGEVREFNGGAAALDSEKFGNRRAENYWKLAKEFEDGVIDIPDDSKLKAQLSDIRYRFDPKGRMFIESKEEMRARGSKSPDRADVLMMLMESAATGRTGKPKQRRY